MSSFAKFAFIAIFLLSMSLVVSPKKYDSLETSDDSKYSDEYLDNKKNKRPYLDSEPQFALAGSFRKSFAFEVFLSKDTMNIVCSPVSALMPLAKLAIGAQGHMQQKLLDAIGVSRISKIKNTFKRLIKQLKYLPGVHLNLASKIYVSDNVHLNKKFSRETGKIFKSSVEKVNFDNAKETEDKINAWIAKETGTIIGKYLDLKVSGKSSLIIINVVVFQGDWKRKFHRIEAKNFHSPTGVVSVPMMIREDYYNYTSSDGLNAQLIEIPYEKEKASFVVILPHSRTGLTALLRELKLAPELLNHAMKKMTTDRVKLSLPKFRMHSKEDLVPIFKSVGLGDLFDSHSGLTGIIRNETMFVGAARQVTIIDVNEKGTKAVAATGMELMQVSKIVNQAVFNADHPFLFFVKGFTEQIFAGVFAGYDP